MNPYQEPKYEIRDGKLHNRQSGEQIPDDEPVFVLRARDTHAIETLQFYFKLVAGGSQINPIPSPSMHCEAVRMRVNQFMRFATSQPSRMKDPDTQMTADWTNRGTP